MSTAAEVTQTSIDESIRRIYLFGTVDESMCQIAIPAIRALDASVAYPEGLPISVHIMTDGGVLSCALAIYDALRTTHSQVYTVAHGDVLSAGVVIFLAGDERLVSRNGSMMFHRPTSDWGRSHQKDYNDAALHLAAQEAQIEHIFSEAGCALAFGLLTEMDHDVWIHGSANLIEAGLATLGSPERTRLSGHSLVG